VTPKDALANLLEQSSRVEAAVIFDRAGKVVGSTIADGDRAKRLAASALELLSEAERRRPEKAGDEPLAQLEVALPGGSAFVVQDDDRLIAATTGPEPTVGLVFYDLKKCLRDLGQEKAKPKRRPTTRKKTTTTRKKKADEGS
jgi:predicted regulator of Ras-like GTPase activity (Roadblock/LC7/MglB family)